MIYGKRPEGMSESAWLVECQCRFVARKMRDGRNSSQRGAIFEQWQKALPSVSKARVAEIWREGVPMPSDQRCRG